MMAGFCRILQNKTQKRTSTFQLRKRIQYSWTMIRSHRSICDIGVKGIWIRGNGPHTKKKKKSQVIGLQRYNNLPNPTNYPRRHFQFRMMHGKWPFFYCFNSTFPRIVGYIIPLREESRIYCSRLDITEDLKTKRAPEVKQRKREKRVTNKRADTWWTYQLSIFAIIRDWRT